MDLSLTSQEPIQQMTLITSVLNLQGVLAEDCILKTDGQLPNKILESLKSNEHTKKSH